MRPPHIAVVSALAVDSADAVPHRESEAPASPIDTNRAHTAVGVDLRMNPCPLNMFRSGTKKTMLSAIVAA